MHKNGICLPAYTPSAKYIGTFQSIFPVARFKHERQQTIPEYFEWSTCVLLGCFGLDGHWIDLDRFTAFS